MRWSINSVQSLPNVTIVYELRFALDTPRWKLKVMGAYTLGLWHVSFPYSMFTLCVSTFLQTICSLSFKIPPGSMDYYLLLTHVPRQTAPSFLAILASLGKRTKTNMSKLLCVSLADKIEKLC